MLQKGGVKIWRPRQLYVGSGERDYVEIGGRQEAKDQDPFGAPTVVGHGGDSKRNKLATLRNERGELVRPKL